MNNTIKVIHIILTIVAWGIFFFSLLRMGIVWGDLPDEIGVHFAQDGTFDVMDDKKFAMYPYLVTVIALLFCELLIWISKKINIGMKINNEGATKVRIAFILLLDILMLAFSYFFAGVWAHCVINQQALNTDIPKFVVFMCFLSFVAFLINVMVIRIKNPQ